MTAPPLSVEFWLGLGVALIFLEFLVPGLISMFIGFGALTVAVGVYYGQIPSLFLQIIVWMFSSLFYLFTLRILILKFYPQDREKTEVDEDKYLIGTVVLVVEDIPQKGQGRIRFSDSTWLARSKNGESIHKGEQVSIQGRDNITYIVEALTSTKTKKEK